MEVNFFSLLINERIVLGDDDFLIRNFIELKTFEVGQDLRRVKKIRFDFFQGRISLYGISIASSKISA